MLILTQSDELNRTYDEDNNLPSDGITSINSASCDDTRRKKTPSKDISASLTEQDNLIMRERLDPCLMASTSTSWQESPTYKETRASIISTGPTTITITSAVPTASSLWLKNTRSHGKERRTSDIPAGKSTKRRSYTLARPLGGNIQTQELPEDKEDKEEDEGIVEVPATSLEEERAGMSLTTQDENVTTVSSPTPTITAWEAGWNVTNAIQVREGSHTEGDMT